MTTLAATLERDGLTLEPIEAAALLSLDPACPWQPVAPAPGVDNVRVWYAPTLRREDFQPTIVVSAIRIRPSLDPTTVLDRLDDTAASLPDWHLRASTRRTDDRGRLVSDTLGDYRLSAGDLTASTLATVWTEGDTTILRQVVVTTFADQLASHGDALR